MSTNDIYLSKDNVEVECIQHGNIFESFTETATANSGSQETKRHRTLSLGVVCSAATGTTPSLTIEVETSYDGTNWVNVGSLPAITAAGTTHNQAFGGLDRFVRLGFTISGTTPSFTFVTSGELV